MAAEFLEEVVGDMAQTIKVRVPDFNSCKSGSSILHAMSCVNPTLQTVFQLDPTGMAGGFD